MQSTENRFELPRALVEQARLYDVAIVDYRLQELALSAVASLRFRGHGVVEGRVEIRQNGDETIAQCDCDVYCDEGRFCEHICATLLRMESMDFPWPEGEPNLVAVHESTDVWRDCLGDIARFCAPQPEQFRRNVRYHYVIDFADCEEHDTLAIRLFQSKRRANGKSWGSPRPLQYGDASRSEPPSQLDEQICEVLEEFQPRSFYYYGNDCSTPPATVYPLLLPNLCATDRLHWRMSEEDSEWHPLSWSDEPWRLDVRVTCESDSYVIRADLVSGESRAELREPVFVLPDHLMFSDRITPFAGGPGFFWAVKLRELGEIQVPKSEGPALIDYLARIPGMSHIALPEELQYEEQTGSPVGWVRIGQASRGRRRLPVAVEFQYRAQRVAYDCATEGTPDHEQRLIYRRDAQREQELLGMLDETPLTPNGDDDYTLTPARMPETVDQLLALGWQVEAEGRKLRKPGNLKLSVESGVDWFDLQGAFQFDDQTAPLPRLLSAVRRGEKYITLDDGSQGLLPQEWLERFGALASLGEADGDSLRFSLPQAALLDALLAAQDHVDLDAKFRRFREKLQGFDGVSSVDPPPSFEGELREYQKEGLGWLKFLNEFHLGGCLADDMGLGKTVQVLALLQARYRVRNRRPPSLVVVPRSLMFNWLAEAEKFTPKLRLLRYFGLDREELRDEFDNHDVVVTTYGIIRRDIGWLRTLDFDHVILDEAQAIKNANSQAAKACRLLNASQRLALTGTPVENHLGELWSIFEFLNPGMLGRSDRFAELGRSARTDQSARQLLAHAIRPYVLRRTKEQVLPDLPAKTESTVFCEMEAPQRKLYDELREYYRQQLAQKVAEHGIKRSKIQVLEALLRLRQAACHPALLDPDSDVKSAKFEALLAHVEELVDKGHKALIFSQFTKLLGLVRRELDDRGVTYEYLDGRTRKREERVRQFQENPDCPLFLISLKAGGHGLNLTAADYVFILDPWWNPAVEAQAVDRVHRIGQDKPVFAYRLICQNTVEEKIVELQQQKKELADAIITADNGVLRDLTAEDLQLLLS